MTHKNQIVEIVKAGDRRPTPFGVYRLGYDIVKLANGRYRMSVINGVEIFKGPETETIADADAQGIAALWKTNRALARNLGLREATDEPEGRT